MQEAKHKPVIVTLNCTKHVAAYLQNLYGTPLRISGKDFLYQQLILSLSFTQKKYLFKATKFCYPITLEISMYQKHQHGKFLNESQTKAFNVIVDKHLKILLVHHLDLYLSFNQKLNKAIDSFYAHINISEDDWTREAIQKYYFRARKERNEIDLKPEYL